MADIGKMSLIVTANASALDKDLGAAEKKIGKFAKGADKKMTGATMATDKMAAASKKLNATAPKMEASSGGGLLAFAGLGAVAGAVGGAIVTAFTLGGKAIMAAGGLVTGFVAKLRTAIEDSAKLGILLSSADITAIQSAQQALVAIDTVIQDAVNTIAIAFAPAIEGIAGVFVSVWEDINPIIQAWGAWASEGGKLALVLAMAWEVVAGTVRILAQQILGLWQSFAGASGVTDWFERWPAWEEKVKAVLKGMALGFAYVWDTLKAGAGIVANVFGMMAKNVATLARTFNELAVKANDINPLSRWTGKIPQISDSLLGFLDKIGDGAALVGANMIGGFGKTVSAINDLFDNLQVRQQKLANFKMPAYQATAALQFGSKEEASVLAKFRFEGKMKDTNDLAKQQLNEAKAQTALLRRLADKGDRNGERLEIL